MQEVNVKPISISLFSRKYSSKGAEKQNQMDGPKQGKRERRVQERGCERGSMEESVKEQRRENVTDALDMWWSGRRQWRLKSRYQIVNGLSELGFGVPFATAQGQETKIGDKSASHSA